MNPVIEILISPRCDVQIQTKGFSGSGCRAASQFVEQALGTPLREQLTSEFHQQACGQQSCGQQTRQQQSHSGDPI